MKLRLRSALVLPALTLVACGGAAEKPPVVAATEPGPAVSTPAVAPTAPPVDPPAAPVLAAPTGCTASPPSTLQPSVPNASSPVSAVLTGETLWVLHTGVGKPNDVPELLEVSGAASPSQKVTAHALPSGSVGTRGALAAYKGGVIGTFVGAAGVTVFHKPAQGDVKIATSPAGDISSNGSIALVGGRALVSFGESQWGVHVGWFDVAAMRADGPLQKIAGSVQQAAVADAFGGVVFYSESTGDRSPMQLRARIASGAAAPFALPAIGSDNGSGASATGSGGRAFVIYNTIGRAAPGAMFPSSTVKVATITSEKGAGTTVLLGPGGLVTESAIQRTSWGAMAAFSNQSGSATAAFVNNDGALIGSTIVASAEGERVRQPAIAAGDRSGYVVWNQVGGGGLRVARVTCK